MILAEYINRKGMLSGTDGAAEFHLSVSQFQTRRLIEKHGYWRRKEELEDAERVIGKAA
ncbi:MAG: hypothetical protein WB870_11440 [Gallionellaceae bacterium]